MDELTSILQCESCLAFFDEEMRRLDPQPTARDGFFIPQTCRCAACVANPPLPAMEAPRAPAAVNVAPSRPVRPLRREAVMEHARGCPRDTEPVHESLSAEDYERYFRTTIEASDGERKVLALLSNGFDGKKPGHWCTGILIQDKCAVKAANSCAARLRAKLTSQYDIDSQVVPGGHANEWQYRLCLATDSLRLRRRAGKSQTVQ